jgi:hypothetical protein
MKGVQSNEKLDYRGILLDATVLGIAWKRGIALSHVLKIRPFNIYMAAKRRAIL